MIRPNRLTLTLALAGLMVTSRPPLARAQAAADTEQFTIPFAQTLAHPCTGETLNVEGEAHDVFHFTITGDGKLLDGAHTQLRAKGTSDAGTDYVVSGVLSSVTNFNPATFELTLIDNLRFIGQGGGSNFRGRLIQHVTINASGDTTVDSVKLDTVCGD
jgi:hypothetical protein